MFFLTCVNEPAWGSFAELFGFVRQCHFHNSRDVPGRGLDSDGMRGYKLRRGETGKTVTKQTTQEAAAYGLMYQFGDCQTQLITHALLLVMCLVGFADYKL